VTHLKSRLFELFNQYPIEKTKTHICLKVSLAIVDSVIKLEIFMIKIIIWIDSPFQIIG